MANRNSGAMQEEYLVLKDDEYVICAELGCDDEGPVLRCAAELDYRYGVVDEYLCGFDSRGRLIEIYPDKNRKYHMLYLETSWNGAIFVLSEFIHGDPKKYLDRLYDGNLYVVKELKSGDGFQVVREIRQNFLDCKPPALFCPDRSCTAGAVFLFNRTPMPKKFRVVNEDGVPGSVFFTQSGAWFGYDVKVVRNAKSG